MNRAWKAASLGTAALLAASATSIRSDACSSVSKTPIAPPPAVSTYPEAPPVGTQSGPVNALPPSGLPANSGVMAPASGGYEGTPQAGEYTEPQTTGEYEEAPQAGEYTGLQTSGGYEEAPQTGEYTEAPQTGEYTGAPQAGEYTGAPQAGEYTGAPQAGEYTGAPHVGESNEAPQAGEVNQAPSSGEPAETASTEAPVSEPAPAPAPATTTGCSAEEPAAPVARPEIGAREYGAAVNRHASGCFVPEGSSGVKNVCRRTQLFKVPITSSAPQIDSLDVSGYAPSRRSGLGCTAYSATPTMGTYWASPTAYLQTYGAPATFKVPRVHVGLRAPLYAACQVGPGAELGSFSY